MSDVDHLKEALTSILAVDESEAEDEKKKYQQGLSEILAKLTTASELQSALDVVLQSSTKDTSLGLLKRVQFFSDIHLIASKDAKLTAYICNLKLSNFEEIARQIYFSPRITPDVSDETLQTFRSYLFQNQPIAVFLGLIEGGSIKIGPSEVKANVVAILSSAMNDGFDLSRDSTRVLFKQITFPESVSSKTRNGVIDAIKQIQRLQALVREPEHVGLLIKADYSSASSIANTELATFQEEMEE
ncbi:hypothetical protein TGAMA5MH_07574 [Trichoderma gamsii]|uniref:Uncharacterized protein n=1 Tax=Trichoderma gamsii TaxID=398673 RepID=A0A2K0T4W8_9HYPO|nr:hypothetical protein TGAMA5MH_07574 [Trichoderma gamsii]